MAKEGMEAMEGMNGDGAGEVIVDIGCHVDEADKKVLVVRTGIQDVRYEFSSERDARLADHAATILCVAFDTMQMLGKRIGEMKVWNPAGEKAEKKGGEG